MYDCPLGDGFSCSAASKVRGDEVLLQQLRVSEVRHASG